MEHSVTIPGDIPLSAAMDYSPSGEWRGLAVLLPGFLDSKDYLDLATLAAALESRGYFVVRFDPAGTWESGGEIEDYTMTRYLKDIGRVVEYAEWWAGSKFRRVVVGGHSFGGQVAIAYGCRNGVSGIVAVMPPHSAWGSMSREEWEKRGVRVSERDRPPDRNGTREYRVPLSFAIDRERYDTLKEAGACRAPLLLVAGGDDTVVPAEGVRRIYDAAYRPKDIVILDGIGHDYRHFSTVQTDIVNGAVLALMGKHGL